MPSGLSAWDRATRLSNQQIEGNALLARERMAGAQTERAAFPQNLASMADPYSKERDQVIRDPSGALNNSPFFKFMQEKYTNAATAKNAAGGFRNSGRGLMALGEASQKASADYMFPYLQALGRPQTGANAFWEAYKYLNPQFTGGGGSSRAPTRSLAMAQSSPGSAVPAGAPAAATGLPSGGWENPYGSGMGPVGPLAGYGPSSGSGTGSWSSSGGGSGYFGYPYQDIDMGV